MQWLRYRRELILEILRPARMKSFLCKTPFQNAHFLTQRVSKQKALSILLCIQVYMLHVEVWWTWGFPGGSVIKNSPAIAENMGSIPGLGRSPQRREWQPSPVFLPGKSRGQRGLVWYSTWGCKESDVTKWLNNNNNKWWTYIIMHR